MSFLEFEEHRKDMVDSSIHVEKDSFELLLNMGRCNQLRNGAMFANESRDMEMESNVNIPLKYLISSIFIQYTIYGICGC